MIGAIYFIVGVLVATARDRRLRCNSTSESRSKISTTERDLKERLECLWRAEHARIDVVDHRAKLLQIVLQIRHHAFDRQKAKYTPESACR